MEIAPARCLQILTQLLPARLEALHVGIPLDRLTIGAEHAQLVALVPQARSDLTRQVLATPLEQPDHAGASGARR